MRLPEDLLAELEAQAQSRGLTPDELAVETLRAGLRQQSWQAKAARWQEYGKASGYTADDVPDAKWVKRLNSARGWILGAGLLRGGVAWLSSTLTN